MINGVSVDSVSELATFAAVAGSWSAKFPVTNLGVLERTTQLGRFTGASGGFTAVWPTSSLVQIVALCAHNIAAGSLRVRLFSDAGMTTTVADSGTVAVWPAGGLVENYLPTRPVIFTSPVTARAARVDLTGLSGTTEIGAVEIAQFWDWQGISPGAEKGLQSGAGDLELAGGAVDRLEEFGARIYNGQLNLLAMAIAGTRGLDLQKLKTQAKPFVFVDNYESPATWARSCYLVRHQELLASVGALYRHDAYQFRLKEHVW